MDTLRPYTDDEEWKTFEKIALNFRYTYKDKTYPFIITAPMTARTYDLNLILMDQLLQKVQKFFYTFFICKKQTKIMRLHKICAYIHVLYLMGCEQIKENKDYIFKQSDFELPYRLYQK